MGSVISITYLEFFIIIGQEVQLPGKDNKKIKLKSY